MQFQPPYVLIPRCVPWDMFTRYLEAIGMRFPSHRIVVVESNPANLKRYAAGFDVIPYKGSRFLSEDMLRELPKSVAQQQCRAIVIPISNMDGSSFEQLFEFALKSAPISSYVLTPDLQLRTLSTGSSDVGLQNLERWNFGQTDAKNVDGPVAGSLHHQHMCNSGLMYAFGWLNGAAGKPFGVGEAGAEQPLESAESVCFDDASLEVGRPAPVLRVAVFLQPGFKGDTGLRFFYPSGKFVDIGPAKRIESASFAMGEVLTRYNECTQVRGLTRNQMARIDELFGQVLTDLNNNVISSARIVEERIFGVPAASPQVSLIIPVFKRYELLRHQLATFACDPFLLKQEIIFVLNSVESTDPADDPARCRMLLDRACRLEGISAKLLVTDSNCGYSKANNLAAELAHAPLLLLLNSDIMAGRCGWLEKLISVIEDDSRVGAVGALLRYPEGTIQHAGISWRREPIVDNAWVNTHPFKGMHPSLMPSSAIFDVPAITGACFLIRASDYKNFGMLDDGYIQGDYEDSDLCLRMRMAGKRIVCHNGVELYHLEGSSYSPASRQLAFRYNTLRHQAKWGKHIDGIMARSDVLCPHYPNP